MSASRSVESVRFASHNMMMELESLVACLEQIAPALDELLGKAQRGEADTQLAHIVVMSWARIHDKLEKLATLEAP
jgi:hypothetical protein